MTAPRLAVSEECEQRRVALVALADGCGQAGPVDLVLLAGRGRLRPDGGGGDSDVDTA